jgi:EmrB/QacA subfamily drug resistance transporter
MTASVAGTGTEQPVYARRWWALSVLCLSLLIVFVGNSSLNVAIPTLSRDLHATESQLQWVVAIYSLVFAGLLFTTGALGDRFGRKGALQGGLLLFAIGAVLASQATNMESLIACRALMGLAAALIMPSTLSIIINIFPVHERPKAIAIWASVTGAAGAFGPVISGWLLGRFWFGSIFLINVPIIVVALFAGRFVVPKSRDPEHAAFDPVGALLSVVGIVALVYGLIEAPDHGWGSAATVTSFGIAAVVLFGFVLWELRVDEPMLDMRYFRKPAFSTGTGGMILVFVSMYGVMFLISQYFQLVLGYSALGAALRLMPIALIMLVVAPLTPRLSARFGAHRTVGVGMLAIAGGLALFNGVAADTSYAYVVLCVIPLATGIALSMSPMTASIMGAVPERRAGAGSAMNDATRELGAALGIAILGSVAASHYATKMAPFIRSLGPADQDAARTSIAGALRVAGHLPARAGQILTAAADNAFVDGVHLAVTVGAILATISAVIVYKFLPHSLTPTGAMHGAVESLEDAAELGLAGVPPIFADTESDEQRSA